MKKLTLAFAILFSWGLYSAKGQIYIPLHPTVYGDHVLRIKPDSVQHIPQKVGSVLNTADTTAQIFLNKSDSSVWAYYKPKGFFKVGSASGTTTYWNLSGNTGTSPGTNFIGNTDNVGIMFKTNNIQSGLIDVDGNTSIGYQSLLNNSGGFQNVAFGYGALKTAIFPVGNTALGYNSLNKVVTGGNNTAVGNSALLNNTGSSGVAFGSEAAKLQTTGTSNTAIGTTALKNNITGNENTVLGFSAGYGLTRSDNIAIGYLALSNSIDTGTINISIGNWSMSHNISGYDNVTIGQNGLLSNTTGFKNTSVGAGSMENSTTAYENTFVGEDAGLRLTTGIENVGTGWLSWAQDTTGSYNTGIGVSSGRSIGIGDRNTFIGNGAGYGGVQANNVSSCIGLGFGAHTTTSNQFSISDSIKRFTFAGISRGTANWVLTDSLGNGQYWVPRPLSVIGISTLQKIFDNEVGGSILTKSDTINLNSGVASYLLLLNNIGNISGGKMLLGNDNYNVDISANHAGIRIRDDDNAVEMTLAPVGSGLVTLQSTTNHPLIFGTNSIERIRITETGIVGIGTSSPTALLHLYSGTTVAGTAPLKFTSGSLTTTPEIGAVHFQNGLWYLDSSNSIRDTIATRRWTRNNISGGSGGGVSSVSGTTNRITSTGGSTPIIDISASYIGQSSITTLGTIGTGTLGTGAVIGGVTMTLGSDANYDMYYRNSSGILTRLANGTTGQVITATTGSSPSWASVAGGIGGSTGSTDKAILRANGTGGSTVQAGANATLATDGTGTFNGVTVGTYGGAKGITGTGDFYVAFTGGTLISFLQGSQGFNMSVNSGVTTGMNVVYGGNTGYIEMGSNLDVFGSAGETRIGAAGTKNILTVATTAITATKPVVLKGYTVATLPTGVQGMTAFVTDALTPAFLVTIVGGGSVVAPVFYNGTNWVAQ